MKTRLSPAFLRVSIPVLIIVFSVGLVTLGWCAISTQLTQPAQRSLSHNQPTAVSAPQYALSSEQVAQRMVRNGNASNQSQNSLTPNLLNLTQAPVTVTSKMPAWSPIGGGTFAFLSNGYDATGVGTLNALSASPTSFNLYTMDSDGSNLTLFNQLQPIGSVNGLAWRPDNGASIYLSMREGNPGSYLYILCSVDIATGVPSPPLQQLVNGKMVPFQSTVPIGALAVASNNATIYFEMQTDLSASASSPTKSDWNIYSLPTNGGVLRQLTTGSNNRHPALVNNGQQMLYDSDQYIDGTGAHHYAIYEMNAGGGLSTELTFPPNGANDTQPQLTQICPDGQQYYLFTSSRPTTSFSSVPDTRAAPENIWVFYANPSTKTNPQPFPEPGPRFYPDASPNWMQHDPAAQIQSGLGEQMLFVSNKSGSDNIWIGPCYDHNAPFVVAPPVVTPSKVVNPGTTVTVSVPVTDSDTGVGHVWLQIKNPNCAVTDYYGKDHTFSMPAGDPLTALNGDTYGMPGYPNESDAQDKITSTQTWYIYNIKNSSKAVLPTSIPVEFELLDPHTNSYLGTDSTNPLISPDAYAFAGSDNYLDTTTLLYEYLSYNYNSTSSNVNINTENIYALYYDRVTSNQHIKYEHEGELYPKVAPFWLEMFDDLDLTKLPAIVHTGNHTGVYACAWTTPTQEESDWYLDVIVEDANPVSQDDAGQWHGYRRRFDNVGGCSNMPQIGGGNILLVDDYADAQRFTFYGLNGATNSALLSPAPTTGIRYSYGYVPVPYAGFQNMGYFFQTAANRSDDTGSYYGSYQPPHNDSSPFVPNSITGGSQLWRVLCRGPVTQAMLTSYLPQKIPEYSYTYDPRNPTITTVTPTTVTSGNQVVVWVSPNSYDKLTGGAAAGSATLPSGTLLEQQTQNTLAWFVQNGGRLFVDAPDLPNALVNMGQTNPQYATWQANAAYTVGATVQPTTANGYYYTCTVAGKSGAAQPVWKTIAGAQVTDGGVTWMTYPSSFMSTVLGATPYMAGARSSFYNDLGYLWPDPIPFDDPSGKNLPLLLNTCPPGLMALSGWYGSDLADGQWVEGVYQDAHDAVDKLGFLIDPYGGHVGREQMHQHATLPLNANPDASYGWWTGSCLIGGIYDANQVGSGAQTSYFGGQTLTWEPLVLNPKATKARKAFSCTYANDYYPPLYYKNWSACPYTVGVSNEYGLGRSVFWTFGYYDLSLGYRNRPVWDTLEWMRDGTVRGRVMQNNPNGPITGALVSENSGTAVYTDQNGNFVLQGLRPGNTTVTVTAPGYSPGNMQTTSVVGGGVEYLTFYLTQNRDLSTLTGFVTLRGTSVSGATVQAIQAGGNTYTTMSQANGAYSFTLPAGQYNLTGTDPTTGQSNKSIAVDMLANETATQDLELAIDLPDLQISTTFGANYLGGGVYDKLAEQTITTVAQPSITTPIITPWLTQPYYMQLQNEGNSDQAMVVTGPATLSNAWTIAYYDTDNYMADITAAVTSAQGWTSPVLAANGGVHNLEVDLTPTTTALPNAQQQVIVHAALAINPGAYDEVDAIMRVPGPIKPTVTLTASPSSPSMTQTNITLTASASGGYGTLQYQFWVQKPDGTQSILHDFNASSSCVWIPQTPTPLAGPNYQLWVVVQDTGATTANTATSAKLNYVVNANALTSASLVTIPAGATIPSGAGFTYHNVALVATAVGGGEPEYKFTVSYRDANNTLQQRILQDYGTTSTCTWMPTYPTTYNFQVQVEDLMSGNTVLSPVVPFVVTVMPLSTVVLATNPNTPRSVSVPVALTATPDGGYKDQFQFVATLGGVNSIIQDYSASSSCVWSPSAPGNYTVTVNVKDTGVTPQTTATFTLSYQITPVLSAVNFTASPTPARTLPLAQTITLTAAPIGGANLVYQFWVSNNNGQGTPVLLQDYSASANCTWNPATVDNYVLTVNARDLNGVNPATVVSNTLSYAINVNLSAVALAVTPASPCSPVPPGTTVTTAVTLNLTATATGGANVFYTFQMSNDNGVTWAAVSPSSTSNAASWTPPAPGNYLLQVLAQDMNVANPVPITSTTMAYTITAPLTNVALTVAPPSPRTTAQTSYVLTAAPTGGANLAYQFTVSITSGMTLLKNYSASATCSWTPPAAGTYTLTVNVEDLNGANPATVLSSTTTYVITNPLSGVTLSATPTSPQTTSTSTPVSVTLTATAVGGANNLYTFQVVSANNPNWTTLSANSPSAQVTWSPLTTGNYTIQVIVSDANGQNPLKTVQSQLLYIVTNPLASATLTANLASPRTVQASIILTALAVGGAQNNYAFYADNGNGPVLIAGYSTSRTAVWQPAQAGTYNLTVNVKDLNGVNPTTVITSTAVPFVITTPLSATPPPTLTGTPVSPVAVNLPVTLTASATGGALLSFQFTATNSQGNMTIVQPYGSSSTCMWTPATIGTYTLGVNIQDTNGLVPSATISTTRTYTVTNQLASVSLAATPPTPRPVGITITLTASSTGGANVQYQFLVNNTAIRNYSASASCTWTPSQSGTYSLSVVAEDMNAAIPTPITSTPISYKITQVLSAVSLSAVNQSTNTTSPGGTVGSPVLLTATPTGGANVLYQYYVNGALLQDFSSATNFVWTPQQVTTYTLLVKAKDAYDANQASVYSSTPLSFVVMADLSAVSLAANPSSPRVVNTPITLTAAATGGANDVYQFTITNAAGTTTILQSYSASPTCVWTPSTVGNYTLQVLACDSNGLNSTQAQASSPLSYVITPALSLVSFTNPTVQLANSSWAVGTPINLTAQVTGGALPVYKFLANNTVIQDYSTSPQCIWTPSANGYYNVTVAVKDLDSAQPTVAITSTPLLFNITSALSLVSLNVSPQSPGQMNAPVTLTATALGGANMQYEFLVNSIVIRNYSASASCTWTPTQTGTYSLIVSAKDLNSAQPTQTLTTTPLQYQITSGLISVSLTVNPQSPGEVNVPVTLTASNNGGSNVSYKFVVTSGNQSTVLADFNSAPVCQWVPPATGSYTLTVYAKDIELGTTVQQTISQLYVINTPQSSTYMTVNPASTSSMGTPVTLTANSIGGAHVQYQFWVYNPALTPAWSQVQAYSSQNTCIWTPPAPGSYLISGTGQDLSGIELNATVWHTVTSPLLTAVSATFLPASPQAINTPTTITATATGGFNDQYQFWIYHASATPAWSQLQAYSAQNTCSWIPTSLGNYLISITARDSNTGTEVNKMYWDTITPTAAMTAVSVTSSPASPQPVNTTVSFSANAIGGTNVQYEFWVYHATATPAWSRLQAYSSQNSCSWTPAALGSYLISVTAKDGATGTEVNQLCWYAVTSAAALSAVTVSATPASPQPANTTINLSAATTGGTNMQYQFWVYNATATQTWGQLQAYSIQSTCAWIPTTAGTYLLSITARDGITGMQVNTTMWYTVW